MMNNYTINLPRWTVGSDVLSHIPEICAPYGRSAVIIGGHRALASIEDGIRHACDGALTVTGTEWYGGEASEENVSSLSALGTVTSADMIFAVGGGKALDTCKTLGLRLNKPVFTFPTIASTCAACTAVAILYKPDGTHAGNQFLPAPPAHTFIQLPVIAKAPRRYLWAGIGDTYAKYFEADVSARGDTLAHYHELGLGVSRKCLDPLLRYGEQALKDNEAGLVSDALTQAVLTVIVNTGIASILLTADRIIDYNTALAHAIYYALTAFHDLPVETEHLHGEVVGLGVLALLLVDGQDDMFRTMYDFNKSVGLPTALTQIGVPISDFGRVTERVLTMPDISHYPYRVTADMLEAAFGRLEAPADAQ